MFYQQLNMEDFQALNYATEVIALNSKHPDAVEGIRAFFEKRTPVWNDKLTTRI
jgi:enoyl-CoA hydratase/carnithine racemase